MSAPDLRCVAFAPPPSRPDACAAAPGRFWPTCGGAAATASRTASAATSLDRLISAIQMAADSVQQALGGHGACVHVVQRVLLHLVVGRQHAGRRVSCYASLTPQPFQLSWCTADTTLHLGHHLCCPRVVGTHLSVRPAPRRAKRFGSRPLVRVSGWMVESQVATRARPRAHVVCDVWKSHLSAWH